MGMRRLGYLASIIDGCSRKIVGWSLATHMRTSLVNDALKMAIERQRPGIGECVIHSDRGSPIHQPRIPAASISERHHPLGRTRRYLLRQCHVGIVQRHHQERTHSPAHWPTFKKLKKEVFEYIEVYYNNQRPHTQINHCAPSEVEKKFHETVDNTMLKVA